MKVALISMPWCDFATPSAAIGALSAYIRTRMPRIELTCHSEHLEIYGRLGPDVYLIFRNNRILGESLYLSTLFPEYWRAVKSSFVKRAAAEEGNAPETSGFGSTWDDIFDTIRKCLSEHLDTLAESLARDADLVGITTSLSQTFSSLSLARRIKQMSPGVRIVLGGAAVYGERGRAMLREFSFIDYIIGAEGEIPFEGLLAALDQGYEADCGIPGVMMRGDTGSVELNSQDVRELDTLPFPDYDEYAEKADGLNIIWSIPVEGSRGCWWDRRARTGNPLHRCYFCNYGGFAYRDKSPVRVAREMDTLTRRYRNVRVLLCENAVRPRGIPELGRALKRRREEFSVFASFRANIKARDILSLYEAGMLRCECGCEGFSNTYLSRLNKGATVIRNLQVLKTCHELGIWLNTNLVINFPGATAREVEETVATIRDYASAYYPPGSTLPFQLVPGSVVDMFREKFDIVNVRNLDDYRVGLPPGTADNLILPEQSWDGPETVNWGPVEEACVRWRELHEVLRKDNRFPATHPLYYHEGGDFLEIVDRRGECRTVTLPGAWRSVYLFCMEIRTEKQVLEKFPDCPPSPTEILEWLVSEKLVYREKNLYLSLAVALTPGHAVRRMKRKNI